MEESIETAVVDDAPTSEPEPVPEVESESADSDEDPKSDSIAE